MASKKEEDLRAGGRKANKKLAKKKSDMKEGGKKANKTLQMEKLLKG